MNFISDYINKYPIRFFFYVAFGLSAIMLAVFIFYRISHSPYKGFYLFPGTKGRLKVIAVDPGSPGDLAGLKVGDRVLTINDQEILNPYDSWETLYLLEPGHSYVITYKREATIITGKLTPDSPVFPYIALAFLILCTILLILSLIFYLKTPSEPWVRNFYLMMVCIVPGPVLISDFQVFWNITGSIAIIFCSFIFPLLLHLVLIPPGQDRIVHNPFILVLIYVPSVILSSICFISSYFHFFAFHSVLIVQSYMGLILLTFLASISIAVYTYFTTKNSEEKKQMKWILWGGAISLALVPFGFYELLQDLPLFLSGGQTLPFTLILSLFNIFIFLYFAVIKYRLMDIDIFINRSLAYFLVSGITILLYFLLFGFFSWLFGILIGKETSATFVVSAFLVAFMFRPLLSRIEHGIDRLFYREKYEFHLAMETLMQALIAVRNPHEIFQKVYRTVKDTFHIKSGVFWLIDQNGVALKYICSLPKEENSSPFFLERSHPLVLNLIKTRKGLTHYQVRTGQQFSDDQNRILEPYQKMTMEIFLPLVYEDTLLGIIGFGEKRSGDLYSSYDVGVLTTLAHQTAVAMENARAYYQTGKLNVQLAEKVKEIEQQQDEILALQKHILNENIYLREEIQQQFNFKEIIGTSPPMKKVLAMVEKIAPTLSTVLLRGESGTGKELIARAIHFNSPRRDAPFVKVNCAAIPANLLESELFGHEKGAFTGAIKLKTGKFELAIGGTIFLDEIGDLELELQVKLLRVLQEKEFERVGGTKTLKVDVRIIAATNRDIEKAISNSNFREDLFYRLNVISITLPPLRERKEDIRELTIHFLRKFSRQMGKSIQNIDIEAIQAFKTYHWPGNIRELSNVIEQSAVLGEGNILSVDNLPPHFFPSKPTISPTTNGTLKQILEQVERQHITEALKKANGKKIEAARILGLKRTTFNSKLKKFNLLS